jgi:hypothetical protein
MLAGAMGVFGNSNRQEPTPAHPTFTYDFGGSYIPLALALPQRSTFTFPLTPLNQRTTYPGW